MQAEQNLKWHIAATLEDKKLYAVEMSGGATADEMWQAWVTDDNVSQWREGDVYVLDREASGGFFMWQTFLGVTLWERAPGALSLFSTLQANKELWGCQLVSNTMWSLKKERGEETGSVSSQAWLQRNTEKSTWARIWDCFPGSHSWKEFTVGLSCALTCYHHPGLNTVITFWPLFCSVNARTTQLLLSFRCWKIQTICKIISKNVSISVHLTMKKAKHCWFAICFEGKWKSYHDRFVARLDNSLTGKS